MTSVEADAPPAKAEPGQRGGPLLATVRQALATAGADQAVIAEAVQAVASGQVYQAATVSVKEQNSHAVRPFFDCLDLVINHIVTGAPLTAAREAAEALATTPPGQGGHHPWCHVDRCKPHRFEDGAVLTEHHGLALATELTDGYEALRLRAELGSDENLIDDHASVFIWAGNNDGLSFDQDNLGRAIDSLDTFLDGLRHLHRVMGQPRAPKTEEQA
ncbi:DUF6907 domain-containing protein [Streptomyces erythrochromogenes]|uniref:DUF6907 domain-containing protein n=1 Tax=Streptomyces erythrochromogenes TaxID=285574 RepID=UPI0033CB3B6F